MSLSRLLQEGGRRCVERDGMQQRGRSVHGSHARCLVRMRVPAHSSSSQTAGGAGNNKQQAAGGDNRGYACSSTGAVEEKGSAFVKLLYSPSARIAHPPSALRDEAVRKLHCIGPCPRASPPGTPSACDLESGLLKTRAWSCIPRLLGCSLTSEACPAVLCLLLHETFPLQQVPYHELGITPVAWRCFACLAARDCASLSRLMLAADPTAAE